MASWYERHILPHLISCCCGCGAVTDQRRKILPRARGRVLELGFGAGHNLAYYDPAQVSEIVGVEPSPELRAIAARATRPAGLVVDLRDGIAEELPFPDASFDTVVSTFTLCTVRDQPRALAEARRVLKSGGRFCFAEHGSAPDAGVARWQRRLDPLWGKLFGGCHLTRPVSDAIGRQFEIASVEKAYLKGMPRIASWVEVGEAVAA